MSEISDLALPSHRHCTVLTSMVRTLRADLAGSAPTQSFDAGAMIYRMGDGTDHLYLVLEGKVRTSIVSEAGKELVVGIAGPGEVFGELCFCDVRERQEQASALEPTTVAWLGVSQLVALTAGSPPSMLELLTLFCHRMAEMEERLSELAFASVQTRIGLLLLRLAAEGEPAADGGFVCRESPTHEEIAARVSTTREQVSTILARFRQLGLIAYQRGEPLRVYSTPLRRALESG